MSVPEGTLTDAYRTRLLEFYGRIFGWREIESLRRPDRLTISMDGSSYINLRERSVAMDWDGYEHFGVVVETAEDLERIATALQREEGDIHVERSGSSDEGFRTLRFRHLLPLAVEVQHFA